MNKQALKLKQKRRAEREALKNEKINKVWDEMSSYAESSGKPQLKKTKEQMLKVYNATKDVDMKILNKSGVITLVCSLIILYKHYDFDKEKLLSYAGRLRKFIISMTSNNRSVNRLFEEIENDYNVPIVSRCQNLPRLSMEDFNKYNVEETIIKSTVDNFPYFIVINAYTFMNHLVFNNKDKQWNAEDLELFISKAFELYTNILTDGLYLKTLNDILMDECDICVNLTTGTVNEIIKQ